MLDIEKIIEFVDAFINQYFSRLLKRLYNT